MSSIEPSRVSSARRFRRAGPLGCAVLVLSLASPALTAPPIAPTSRAPAAAGSKSAPAPGEDAMPIETRRVVGLAAETKLGPVVQTPGDAWRVGGLDAWPPGIAGTRVWVAGHPEAVAQPVGERDAEGNWQQGVAPDSGPGKRLQDARWGPAEAGDVAWSVTLLDGSNNQTTVRFDGEVALWQYRPVTPAESSSGTYSGGTPAAGRLSSAAAKTFHDALWAATAAVEAAGGLRPPGPRAMGEVDLQLDDVTGERRLVLKRGAAQRGVTALVDALRGAPGR